MLWQVVRSCMRKYKPIIVLKTLTTDVWFLLHRVLDLVATYS